MIHLVSKSSTSTLSDYTTDQVQPNAMDLKVDKIFAIKYENMFEISEDGKTHRGSVELKPDSNGWWTLGPGTYEIIMEGEITIGHDEAGWVITRSTLNRNGVFITSGLYDSGYKGVMAGAMHVTGHNGSMRFRIQQGTRVAQFLLFKAEAVNQYDGDYGTGKYDEVYKA